MRRAVLASTAAVALSLALLAGVGGPASLARWTEQARTDAGTLSVGGLTVEPLGDPRWTELSADVPDTPRPVAQGFLFSQGDTVRVTQDYRVDLDGERLAAAARVGWDTSDWRAKPRTAAGVTTRYRVVAGDRELTPWTPIGTESTSDPLGPGAHTVTVEVEMATTGALPNPPWDRPVARMADLGRMDVTFVQAVPERSTS